MDVMMISRIDSGHRALRWCLGPLRGAMMASGLLLMALMLAGCHDGEPTYANLDLRNVETGRAERGTFRVTIDEVGVMQAASNNRLFAPFSGRLQFLAEDGAEVNVGDVLVRLDTQSLRQDLEGEIQNLRLQKADLELTIETLRASMRENILDAEKAEAQLEYDRMRLLEVNRQLETLEALAELDIVATEEVETKGVQFAATRLNVIRSDLMFQSEDIGRSVNENLRRQQLNDLGFRSASSMRRIGREREKLDNSAVTATMAGTWFVAKRWQWAERRFVPLQAGSEVSTGDFLGEVTLETDLKVRSQVSEAFVSYVRPGTPVQLTSSALGGVTFEGRVASVGNAAIEREQSAAGSSSEFDDPSGLRVFELDITLEGSPPDGLKPGMTVDASVVRQERHDVVSIPTRAIFRHDGLPVVFVREGNMPVRRAVTLGERNRNRVVVTEGLKGNEVLFLADLDARLTELQSKSGRGRTGAAVN